MFDFILHSTYSEWWKMVSSFITWSRITNKCAKFRLIQLNLILSQDWHFLVIFDYFWDWKCYQMIKIIFQTFDFTEYPLWMSEMLVYLPCNLIFDLIFTRENTKLAFILKAMDNFFGFQWIWVGTCINKIGDKTS